jgi:hypothetical protein
MSEPQEPKNKVVSGTIIIHVRNTQLAACLISIGVALRNDPPYTVKELPNGERVTTWNFEPKSRDGIHLTQELIKAWVHEPKWSEEHPTHPFTFALHALKNYRQMVEHIHSQKPWVAYLSETGVHTIWVIKGSEREQTCIDLGLERIAGG